uniref:Uncharacterized protein n=1 Tax=Tanacetum cinerariifolium TaxID=118510 RepID=A0A6L2MYB0_TANCI|nr:hypothetical protein [Tanacetum cinerariifolium]
MVTFTRKKNKKQHPSPCVTNTHDSYNRDLILRRKEERSLINTSFLDEYECSSFALEYEGRDKMKRLKQDQEMLVIKIYSEKKKVFRERKKCEKIRAKRGVRDEEFVVGEGVVVTSSSLEMLTNSCLGEIMVSLIFLEGLEEEALVEFMVELFEEDEDGKRNEKDGLFNLKAWDQSKKA